jgi:hypothetical protein
MIVILRSGVLRFAKDDATKDLCIWRRLKTQIHGSFAALRMTAWE